MEAVRVGIIGCGVIGKVHLRVASESPLTEVVAVADLREEARREACEQYGVPKSYADGEELLHDVDVEAVILAMPAEHRTDLAMKAFALGKHVLTEKPVALNAEQVRQMIAARGNLVAACCSSRFTFLESTRVAAEFVGSGALGELRTVHCRVLLSAGAAPTSPPPPWRLSKRMNGGGILVNWGCYDLDYLMTITGWKLKPHTVLARTWEVAPHLSARVAPGSDAETHFCALILCDGEIAFTFERAEFAASRSKRAWEIIGSKGSLNLTMMPESGNSVVITHDDTDAEKGVHSRTIWEGALDMSRLHAGVVEDFASAIREGREPQTNLERSLLIQQITDAIYASAESGRAVEIR